MAAVTGNAHLQIIRIRPAVQAECVIVGLQRDEIAAHQVVLYDGRQVAEVGGERHDAAFRCADAVAAAGHIMAGGKARHREAADFQRLTVHRDCLHRGRNRAAGGQRIQRIGTSVQRDGVLFQKGIQSRDVVGVLVRDEDADAVADRKTQGFQRSQSCAAALAHVDQQILVLAANQCAVAGGAGIQGGKICHSFVLTLSIKIGPPGQRPKGPFRLPGSLHWPESRRGGCPRPEPAAFLRCSRSRAQCGWSRRPRSRRWRPEQP